jgi:hypothetical protein
MTGTLTYKTDDVVKYSLGGILEYIAGEVGPEIVFELVSCLFEVL